MIFACELRREALCRACGVAALSILSAGCATPARPPVRGTMTAPTALIWESRLDREHPLVGRIWDVARARIVEERTLIDRIVEERYVAIGEQHDNPDHHRLEARLIEAMTHGGRKPAAVFEMIDVEAQASVDRSLALHPGSADAMA